MIICLTSETKKINSLLSTRFEQSGYFLFIDTQNRQIETIANNVKNDGAAYWVAEKKPDIIITGNITGNSFGFLKASGIKIVSGVFGITAEEALERYQTGLIKEAGNLPGAAKGRIL